MSQQQTIAAIATAPGRGGIGIIRISGEAALNIAERLTHSEITPRKPLFREFYDDEGLAIDHGLVLFFNAPKSFTGESVVELQGHAGLVVQDLLLQRVCHLGARPARPGEFSQRAFINGKLDLTQAEAIADLIDSGSQAAAKAAMRSLKGEFSAQIAQFQQQLIELRAFTEASLDFVEEEIDFLGESAIDQQLLSLSARLESTLQQSRQGRLLNEGYQMAIAGKPNAGKSSLLNTLVGEETAIVSSQAGTTRDLIHEQVTINGIPVRLTDTAGLHDTVDQIEQEGIRRARKAIAEADIVLYLVDATVGFDNSDQQLLDEIQHPQVIIVFTKADLLTDKHSTADGQVTVSTLSGQGIQPLIEHLATRFAVIDPEQQLCLARERHVIALEQALAHVQDALKSYQLTRSAELMAEDLRHAQRQLDEITGEFSSEDLLGKIFSSFCIGK